MTSWIGKTYFSPSAGGKTTCPLSNMLAHSSTSSSLYQKHQMDSSLMTKNIEFEHINPKITSIFLTLFHLDSGRIFSPTEWLLNPEIKLKSKRYLISSSPSFSSFAAFTDKKMPANQDGVRKNQRNQISKTKTQTEWITHQNLFNSIDVFIYGWFYILNINHID